MEDTILGEAVAGPNGDGFRESGTGSAAAFAGFKHGRVVVGVGLYAVIV